MVTSVLDIAPFVPGDRALADSPLPDKAVALVAASAKLAGHLAPASKAVLQAHMAVINSYYSNLIEGNRTRPAEIRAAQRGDFSADPAKRDRQLESMAHIAVQNWLSEQEVEAGALYSKDFIRSLHRQFYIGVPDNLRRVCDQSGDLKGEVIPGKWRKMDVTVGRHIPPPPQDLDGLVQGFCATYSPSRHPGDRKVIAAMCAHHRFAWIHPFLDGNGRVGRLFTDEAMRLAGLQGVGVWCLSRGLARAADRYRELLARADFPRQGSHDGRGALGETALLKFCEFMLDTAQDQVSYIGELLKLEGLRERIKSYVQARNDGRVMGYGALKPAAANILLQAFIEGELGRASAIEMAGDSERSGRRLISQMKSDGLLTEASNRSPLRWAIPEHAEPWYFPQLAPVAPAG